MRARSSPGCGCARRNSRDGEAKPLPQLTELGWGKPRQCLTICCSCLPQHLTPRLRSPMVRPSHCFRGFLQPFAHVREDHADDHAARWQPAPVCQSRDGGRGGRRDRARPCQGRARREARRRGQGPRHHRSPTDAKLEIVTKTHQDALELLRHDAAHVLAEAVQELFPGTQITFGPATETGFYYDFHRAEHFTPEDFAKIEQRMKRDRRPRRADHARGLVARPGGRLVQAAWRDASRPSGSPPSPRTRRSRSTSRATGWTCAPARICPRRASSARPSS